MRLNEKNVASFAVCSSPVDKEGYLLKKGDLNRDFQRRWFVLKGNLLFYFQKKQDKEPQGVIILEACSVQVSTHGRYCFEISFDGSGTRVYVLCADNDQEMQLWMKAISHASYQYLKSIVNELQRRVDVLSSSSTPQKEAANMGVMNVGHVVASTTPPALAGGIIGGKVGGPTGGKVGGPIGGKVGGPTGGGGGIITTSSTPRETSVTLQELNNPMAPQQRIRSSPSVKIKKGILVDVGDEEAPPIPAKKKSLTMHASTRTPSADRTTYTEKLLAQIGAELDEEEGEGEVGLLGGDITHQQRYHPALVPAKSLPAPGSGGAHSSPLIPYTPILNSTKPLSPPNTLDRTPILTPHSAPTPPGGLDADQMQHNGAVERSPVDRLPLTEPSSHPQVMPKKLAAPLDSSKNFMEMHENFTQAMKALNAEMTRPSHYDQS